VETDISVLLPDYLIKLLLDSKIMTSLKIRILLKWIKYYLSNFLSHY